MNRRGFLTSAGAVATLGVLPGGGVEAEELDEIDLVDGRNEEQYLAQGTDTLGWLDGGRVSADFTGEHEQAEVGLRLQYHDPDKPDTPTRISVENRLEADDGFTAMVGADLTVPQARQLATIILSKTEAVADE